MSAHIRGSRTRRTLTATVVATLALALIVPAASAAPKSKLISQVGIGTHQSAQPSRAPSISGDGKTVAFESLGDELVAGDTNGRADITRRIVPSRKTKLVSRGYGDAQSNASSLEPAISAFGRYVAFRSGATNLTATPGPTSDQIYRRDLRVGKTKLVSKGVGGVANKSSYDPDISANGRYVVFSSAASNLHKKAHNGEDQVYLRDMHKKKTYLVSQANGAVANDDAYLPVVSDDGRYVAFISTAKNLSPKDERGHEQVFLRDRKLNKTFLVSRKKGGKAGDGDSLSVAISGDGRVVVFESKARNLIKWGVDSNDKQDVYKYVHASRTISRVSVNWKGRQLNGASKEPDISADGKIIVFASSATNVIKGGTSGWQQIYRRGLAAKSIELASHRNSGVPGNNDSMDPTVSANGKHVAYVSAATNLTHVGDDNGTTWDIFRQGPY